MDASAQTSGSPQATTPPTMRPTSLFGSAVALRDALRTGEVSSVEAAHHFLARIAEREDLGAFVAVTADDALAEARAADAELVRHRATPDAAPLPPLFGLPIAHKDIVDVAGAPTTMGSDARPAAFATSDHPVVAALRRAGTISLGKTQVPELGLNCYSENRVAAPARNPYDLDRTPGGSSGGSAAAVAAGMLPVAPGSDGGGSIRIPALACGLIGLKPGLGSVAGDVAHGYHDRFGIPTLTVSGPLAHTADDAALLADGMARPTSHGTHREAVRRAGDLTGLTVAMSTESPFDDAFEIELSAAARLAYTTAADRLAALGHRVSEEEFGYDPEYTDFFTEGWIAGLSLLDFTPEETNRLTPLTRSFREQALARSLAEHREAASRLRGFAREARERWGRTDVVLTPGLAMQAPRIGEFMALDPADDYRLQCQWTPYTSMVNVAGLPAVAVPIMRDADGLPAGVQLIGRSGSEPLLLALAAQLTGGLRLGE